MARHLISDAAIKSIRPGDARSRVSDGDGLYLLPFVKGGAHGWRFDYSVSGKRKTLSLGTYPDTTLAGARRRADEYRKLVADGIDPSEVRKAAKAKVEDQLEAQRRVAAGLPAAGTFEALAREWWEMKKGGWSPQRAPRVLARLKKDAFPFIGSKQANSVKPPDLLAVARRVEARGAIDTASTLVQECSQIFRYGVSIGACDEDPARDLRGALRPVVVKHMAAILVPDAAGALLRAILTYEGQPTTRAALLLCALTFQRPGNVRMAEWSEFDLETALWTIPAAKMKRTLDGKKNGRDHLVPLSSQAVAALKSLQPHTAHCGGYLFPSIRSHARPMSDNTINAALRRLGYSKDDMTAHGFRAMARTIMVERLNVNPEVIEAQLAHGKSGPLGMAYDRAEFMVQRRAMMQAWADYLDKLRIGAEVIPIKAA